MATATVSEALAHPTWTMGNKISIDSATLMNKGFEIIEAHHLFGVAEECIEVVIHPQSLVHAAAVLTGGAILAQISATDMRVPISHALNWPSPGASPVPAPDLAAIGHLDFHPPDCERFPALDLARRALRAGGELPAVLNAANEVAVGAFLNGSCSFDRIAATISAVMTSWPDPHRAVSSVDQILRVDERARLMTEIELGNIGSVEEVPSS